MKKVFIIAISEVCDMCEERHKPLAYDTLEKAKNKIKELHDEAYSAFDSEFRKNDFTDESTDSSVEIYVKGRYCEDHYSAIIYEVDVN